MTETSLFVIKGEDGTMYVLAKDWNDAVRKWKEDFEARHALMEGTEIPPPETLSFVCGPSELIL